MNLDKPRVHLTASVSRNGVLVERSPGDLKLLTEFTRGHSIVMGRKTFEYLGSKPLPDRQNWVLSQNEDTRKAIRSCGDVYCAGGIGVLKAIQPQKNVWWVIGGAELFEDTIGVADAIELTVSTTDAEGLKFPRISERNWKLVNTTPHPYEANLLCVRYERLQPRLRASSSQEMVAQSE